MIRGKRFFLISFLVVCVLFFQNIVSGYYDCKVDGCPTGYRCIANGECTTLSVREYCEDHGKPFYFYEDSLLERNCSDILNEMEERLCLQCKGDYELRKNVNDVENIIYGITAGVAVLMLVLNGIKLIIAKDPEERANSKRTMLYVLHAILIITIATKFVEYLIT